MTVPRNRTNAHRFLGHRQSMLFRFWQRVFFGRRAVCAGAFGFELSALYLPPAEKTLILECSEPERASHVDSS
jgi:hypothetical protein